MEQRETVVNLCKGMHEGYKSHRYRSYICMHMHGCGLHHGQDKWK